MEWHTAVMKKGCGAASRVDGMSRELAPEEVISDLLGSAAFPAEVLDPHLAARIIVE
jgi:hypothetical protein